MQRPNSTAPLLLVALIAVGLLAGCANQPMEPTRENLEEVLDLINAAGRTITAKEAAECQTSDEAKRRNMERVFVDPFEDAGFDLDATLADFATRLRNGDFTQDEAQTAMGVLVMYKAIVADLARWEIVRGETRDLVIAAVNG